MQAQIEITLNVTVNQGDVYLGLLNITKILENEAPDYLKSIREINYEGRDQIPELIATAYGMPVFERGQLLDVKGMLIRWNDINVTDHVSDGDTDNAVQELCDKMAVI